MAKSVQKRKAKSSRTTASVCWFDVPANDMGRAKKFYSSLFGWKFAKLSAAVGGYHLVECRDLDEALSIAARIPTLSAGGVIEVRPLMPSPESEIEASG